METILKLNFSYKMNNLIDEYGENAILHSVKNGESEKTSLKTLCERWGGIEALRIFADKNSISSLSIIH